MLTPLVCRVTTVWQFATIVYFRLLYNICKDFSSVLGKVVFGADGNEGACVSGDKDCVRFPLRN